MVTKWAGSIEIGVTTHAPSDLEFPSTMTNVSSFNTRMRGILVEGAFSHIFSQVRSGTWMMTGNGVMHNGTTTVDDYGQNLDKLKVHILRQCPHQESTSGSPQIEIMLSLLRGNIYWDKVLTEKKCPGWGSCGCGEERVGSPPLLCQQRGSGRYPLCPESTWSGMLDNTLDWG